MHSNIGGWRVRVPSPERWGLAILFLGLSLGCALGASAPLDPESPGTMLWALSTTAAAVAAWLWMGDHRLTLRALHLLLAIGTAAMGAIVAAVATFGGAMLVSNLCLWLAMYAGHFLSRRQALAHAGGIATVFGVALQVSGFPVLVPTAAVAGSVLAATLVIGSLVGRLREQARRDSLTGLLNRRGFREAAARELALAARTGWPVAVAVIDLDSFKSVNDLRGHAAGDRVLRRLAQNWEEQLRSGDVLGREGGDEFALLLPAANRAQAQGVLTRLAEASSLAWSAGVTEWAPGEELDNCLSRADQALYRAKRQQANGLLRAGEPGHVAVSA